MTLPKRTTPPTFDRPSDSVDRTKAQETPWETAERRGALDLPRDGSQHRRHQSRYEDMLN